MREQLLGDTQFGRIKVSSKIPKLDEDNSGLIWSFLLFVSPPVPPPSPSLLSHAAHQFVLPAGALSRAGRGAGRTAKVDAALRRNVENR